MKSSSLGSLEVGKLVANARSFAWNPNDLSSRKTLKYGWFLWGLWKGGSETKQQLVHEHRHHLSGLIRTTSSRLPDDALHHQHTQRAEVTQWERAHLMGTRPWVFLSQRDRQGFSV